MSTEKNAFVYPEPADIRDYSYDDVLCEIMPPVLANRRFMSISCSYFDKANSEFKKR